MSSGFISELEIEERKKVRQTEWEKVRRPDQPLKAPEEDYDHRSLFERLQEQKQKREFEFEESHRLKHMIKGLDDDEVEFLDLVDRSKLEEERKKYAEEAREMADFRNRVASLQEQSLENRIQQEIKLSLQPVVKIINKTSQTKLLAGAVVKKRPLKTQNVDPKRPCLQTSNAIKEKDKQEKSQSEPHVKLPQSLNCYGNLPGLTSYEDSSDYEEIEEKKVEPVQTTVMSEPPLQCIGILPGLVSQYDDSSDSESSSFDSSSSDVDTKLYVLGKQVTKKEEK